MHIGLFRVALRVLMLSGMLLAKSPARADDVPITPDAKALLNDVQDAYNKLKSLEVAGTNTFATVRPSGGEPSLIRAEFTGIYAAPNKFKYDSGDQIMVKSKFKFVSGSVRGCTGTKVYGMGKSPNARVQVFDVPAAKISDVNALMMMQGLTWDTCAPLYFAAYKEGTHRVYAGLPLEKLSVAKGADIVIDGKSYLTIERKSEITHQTITLAIDSQTKMIRRTIDETITSTGGKLTRTIEFTSTKPDAPVKDADFEWTAPPEK